MRKWDNYEATEVIGVKRKLPAGGYVCKIIEAEEKEYGWGSVLLILFDIAEGEYKNFYREQYEKQNGDKKWKGVYRLSVPKDDGTEKDVKVKKGFKTFIHHIESSNEGYKWDWNETGFRGKKFGGVFGEKEYDVDGNSGFYTTIRYTGDVRGIENVPVPKQQLLGKGVGASGVSGAAQSNWSNNDALPF